MKTSLMEVAKFVDRIFMVIGYGMLWHRFGLYVAFMVFCVLGTHEIGSARLVKILLEEKGE